MDTSVSTSHSPRLLGLAICLGTTVWTWQVGPDRFVATWWAGFAEQTSPPCDSPERARLAAFRGIVGRQGERWVA